MTELRLGSLSSRRTVAGRCFAGDFPLQGGDMTNSRTVAQLPNIVVQGSDSID